ncbi:MAG TPA: ElyC/SanA/YdcF family protein [Bacteroidia bacterium]|nr:ElyC/SanA/YdcF family protein [Bacteroidia bacterium]
MISRIKSFFNWFVSNRWKRWIFIYSPIAFLILIFVSDYVVRKSAEGKLYNNVADVPMGTTALVFGTSPFSRGQTNLFYEYRMRAVAALWKAGKVKHIIVSGDNSTQYYDEATAMKKALNETGVPDSVITLDYAGFRTLDSVVRCKWVFGQSNIILVSQQFQNERAIFIANHFGITAVGFNAEDVPEKYSIKTRIREYFARVKAVLDIYVLGTQPKFPGPPEPIKL